MSESRDVDPGCLMWLAIALVLMVLSGIEDKLGNIANALNASADTHPKDGDVKQAPLVSGAVPDRADAQTPPPSPRSAASVQQTDAKNR